MGASAEATTTNLKPSGGYVTGIVFLIFTTLGFACTDASAKWLNLRGPALQTVAVRYAGAFLITACFLNPRSRPGILRTSRPGLQVARALCVLCSSLSGFSALRTLPITVVTSITFAAPLLVAVLAGPVLGETIGPRRVVAVIVGFLGVLVITRPGTSGFQPAMWLAVIAAGCNCGYILITRLLARHDSSETTHFYTGLVGTLASLPLGLWVWETPTLPQTWIVMALISAFGAGSHWLLILAHKLAPASVLSPFFYSQLLFAAIIGAVLFGNVPDRWTIIGGVIVISSGLYLLYRERVRQRPPSVDVAA